MLLGVCAGSVLGVILYILLGAWVLSVGRCLLGFKV